MQAANSPRIVFISCNEVHWGGSEELWAKAALALVQQGADVRVAKPNVDRTASPIKALQDANVKITDLHFWLFRNRLANFILGQFRLLRLVIHLASLWGFLWRTKPDLIVLSQGGSWDGFYMYGILRRFSFPYVLICQKGTDLYWPHDGLRDRARNFVSGAQHVFFVSQHNMTLLEEQLGIRLKSGSVVRNPFLVSYNAPQPWPVEADPVRLACVGRLYTSEKGQDLLLRVLASPKWRARNLIVNFYGEGVNRDGLTDMATHLGCSNVRFHGHTDNVEQIWATHHGLVLPSRAEGLPLVLVETMLAGRVAIISRAGGSSELVDDGQTGFLMGSADEEGLDTALERAWQRRHEWAAVGAAAAHAVRQKVPRDPAGELAKQLLSSDALRRFKPQSPVARVNPSPDPQNLADAA